MRVVVVFDRRVRGDRRPRKSGGHAKGISYHSLHKLHEATDSGDLRVARGTGNRSETRDRPRAETATAAATSRRGHVSVRTTAIARSRPARGTKGGGQLLALRQTPAVFRREPVLLGVVNNVRTPPGVPERPDRISRRRGSHRDGVDRGRPEHSIHLFARQNDYRRRRRNASAYSLDGGKN